MRIAFFEVNKFEEKILKREFEKEYLKGFNFEIIKEPLGFQTVDKVHKNDIISVFIYSKIDENLVKELKKKNVKFITTRSTGFNHIDLKACKKAGIIVSNVPCYGAVTVAEYTFALILSISRKIIEAQRRAKRGNFSLDNLRGFDLQGKTLGVIGTGRIGREVVRIARGFEMNVICFDAYINKEVEKEVEYVKLEELLKKSDIITLHLPLLKSTYHILNKNNIPLIKKGAVLINTARGELIETDAFIDALDSGRISYAGLDVLEGEKALKSYEELKSLRDKEQLKTALKSIHLIKRDNVIVTGHNAFNTDEALERIVKTTIGNLISYVKGEPKNIVN